MPILRGISQSEGLFYNNIIEDIINNKNVVSLQKGSYYS